MQQRGWQGAIDGVKAPVAMGADALIYSVYDTVGRMEICKKSCWLFI